MDEPIDATEHYLFASDFGQTLSFNDSGVVPSDWLTFHERAPQCTAQAEPHLKILAA